MTRLNGTRLYQEMAAAILKTNYKINAVGWRDAQINEVAEFLKIVFTYKRNSEKIIDELNVLYKYHPDTIRLNRLESERNCENFNKVVCDCFLPDKKFEDYYCQRTRRERALNDEERKSIEYCKWRTAVYERDNYTCQKCGAVGGKLNAHHIEHFAKNKEKRLDLTNGITLCEKCHKEVHKHGK